MEHYVGAILDPNIVTSSREYSVPLDFVMYFVDIVVGLGILHLVIFNKSRKGLPPFYTIGLTLIAMGLLWQAYMVWGRLTDKGDLVTDWSMWAAKDVGIAFIFVGNLLYRRKKVSRKEYNDIREDRQHDSVVERIVKSKNPPLED